MTAYSGNTSAQPTWPGATAQAEFFSLLTAFLSMSAASSRPANVAAGGIWSKDLGGGAYDLMKYDGAADVKLMSQADLVGAVSIAGGKVTGAAQNIGYGANGLWATFASGLTICARKFSLSGPTTWTLPVAFSDTAKAAVFATASIIGSRYCTAILDSTTSATIRGYNAAGTLADFDAYAFAIGTWDEEFL